MNDRQIIQAIFHAEVYSKDYAIDFDIMRQKGVQIPKKFG